MPRDDTPRAPVDPTVSLRFENVVKEFRLGEGIVRALDSVSLEVRSGEFLAVVGRSGSGKSTLLNLAAGIDTPSSGNVWIAGVPLAGLDDDALTVLRRDRIGVIYQFFNLLSTLSVRENVALPALLGGGRETEVLARADQLLDEVGLAPRRDARPHVLSGGEMQRAAIARALIQQPRLVLADEPTGNLDSRAAEQVIGLLRSLCVRHGVTVVLVTHSREAAAAADRLIELRDGRIAIAETLGARP